MERKDFFDWLSAFMDAESFLHALENQKKGFRINTLKVSETLFDSISNIKCSTVGWYDDARVCEEKIKLGSTMEYFLGYLHPQSLSSMIPPLILEPTEEDYVLDIAAAPGSKATQIAALMKNKGTLVANDLPKRELAIVSNSARLGVLNIIITNKNAIDYPLRDEFSKVILDAPCTALGSNLNAIERFSIEEAKKISVIQKKMMMKSFDALQSDGVLVYSTCTVSPQENEEVVKYLLERREEAKLENINLEIPHEGGLNDYGNEMRKCWRVQPQHTSSEGFFIAKISKG